VVTLNATLASGVLVADPDPQPEASNQNGIGWPTEIARFSRGQYTVFVIVRRPVMPGRRPMMSASVLIGCFLGEGSGGVGNPLLARMLPVAQRPVVSLTKASAVLPG
jgi:hypothetical protein